MSGWGDKTGSSGAGGVVIPIGPGQIPGDTQIPDPSSSYYNAVSSVAASVLTNVLTYTVPTSTNWHLTRVEFGGLNIARYWLYFDTSEVAQHVTWFNGGMTGLWDFSSTIGGGLQVATGTVIRVKVEHGRPFTADFFARINFIQIN